MKSFPKPIKRTNEEQRALEFRWLANKFIDSQTKAEAAKVEQKLINWSRANPRNALDAAELARSKGYENIAGILREGIQMSWEFKHAELNNAKVM